VTREIRCTELSPKASTDRLWREDTRCKKAQEGAWVSEANPSLRRRRCAFLRLQRKQARDSVRRDENRLRGSLSVTQAFGEGGLCSPSARVPCTESLLSPKVTRKAQGEERFGAREPREKRRVSRRTASRDRLRRKRRDAVSRRRRCTFGASARLRRCKQ